MNSKLFYFTVFILLYLQQCFNVNAQTDTEFWFAAPDISWVHGKANNGDGRPFYLHMSAVHNTTITISRPSDAGFTDITVPLMEGESYSLRLDNLLPNLWDDIEVHGNGTIQQKGFKITATPGEITAFYELNSRYNRDIFSLKGKNALGTEFTVTTQNIYDNDPGYGDAKSGFVVVATQPNTIVQVDLGTVDYENHPGGGIVSITLPNPGDAYNFRVVSPYAANHPQGVNVKVLNSSPGNENPIAVTVYDDSMIRNNQYGQGGCRDTYGDQIVPDALLGFEYIVMKGNLGDPNPPVPAPNVGCNGGGLCRTEFVFITAIFDNTDIFIDGTYEATIHKGGVYPYSIFNKYTYIRTTSPSSVTHITGTGGGCEQGGAILPTIDGCTGSHNVTFAHSVPTSDDYQLNIMMRTDPANRTDAVKHFNLRVNGSNYKIPENYFEYSADSAFAFLIDDIKTTKTVYNWINNRIPSASPPTVATISNPEARFHLGVLHGGRSNGAKYGYFSDYARNTYSAGIGGAYADQYNLYCNLDPFQVVAKGGLEYTWSCEDMVTKQDLTHKISDIKAEAPYFDPDTAGFYEFTVNIKGDCSSDTNIVLEANVFIGPTSEFEMDKSEGCSPLTVNFTNNTDLSLAENMYWVVNNHEIIDDMPMDFSKDFVNNSDTVQQVEVILHSTGPKGGCLNKLGKTITVMPAPSHTSDFSVSEVSEDCKSKTVLFENKSAGSSIKSYLWNLGDGTTEKLLSGFEHKYNKYTDKDSIFEVSLEVKDTNGCIVVKTDNVTINQEANAKYTMNVKSGCSPLFLFGENTSVGISEGFTYSWYFGKELVSDNKDLVKELTNNSDTDSTIQVSLVATSNSCSDTAWSDVVVFPAPKAIFSTDKENGCSPLAISTANNSTSQQNSIYKWYINGKLVSEEISPVLTLENGLDSTVIKQIRLDVMNANTCLDSAVNFVEVYPTPKAIIEANPFEGFSPLTVNFINKSERADKYNWNFGNGETSKEKEPSHTFKSDSLRFFFVEFKAENENCADTSSLTIKVKAKEVSSLAELKNEKTAYYFDQLLDQLYVNLSIGQQSDVKVTVFNLTGRLEVSKSMKALLPGEHQEVLYLERLVAGAYILRIETDNEVISGKFIKR